LQRKCNFFVTIHARLAVVGGSWWKVSRMNQGIELISHEDRVALAAQEAVFVLAARHVRRRTQVFVTGPDEERTCDVVKERLGGGFDVVYCGHLPRELGPRPCRGYREVEPACLQLRYLVHVGQSVASVEVVEDGDAVVVLGVVCLSAAGGSEDQVDHSYHVYLNRPLGDRVVIDAFTRAPIPSVATEARAAA
jgi:hypothetical protein